MIRLLLILLLVFCGDAIAQEAPPPYTITITENNVADIRTQAATPLNFGDDVTANISLGFDFTLFGRTFNSAWISSNGFLNFENSANGCCDGQPLNSPGQSAIYAFWTDLNDSGTGSPYYLKTPGKFTVGWYNVPEYATQNLFSFEITLFETTNNVQLTYGSMPNLSSHVATSGLVGQDGFVQLFRGSNSSSLSTLSFLYEPAPIVPVDTCDVLCLLANVTYDLPSAPIQTTTQEPQQTLVAEETAVEPAAKEEQVSQNVLDIVLAQVSVTTPQQTKTNSVKVDSSQQEVDSSSKSYDGSSISDSPQSDAFFASNGKVGSNELSGSSAESEQTEFLTNYSGFAFAPKPQTTNNSAAQLELLGVLKQPTEPESKELPAPGNAKEQQGELQSGNYLEMDQTGLVVSMGHSASFDAYKSRMLVDATTWYKPEDIYKNNSISDRKREMYFLQKSSSDTYNQMVEGQYK